MGKFKAALDNHTFKAAVDKDLADARELGVQGTPNFFINGRPMRGAVPYEQFKTVVDEEIARAKKLLDKGTSVSQLYAAFVTARPRAWASQRRRHGRRFPTKSTRSRSTRLRARVGKRQDHAHRVLRLPVPLLQSRQEHARRATQDLQDNLQISFKQFPLPFHNNAMPAAIASVAADQQGKFWPMYDKLFANQQNLDAASLEKYAQEIGLDVAKFKTAIADPKTKRWPRPT